MIELLNKFNAMEIDISISSFFDSGWHIQVDRVTLNEFKHELETYDLDIAIVWLRDLYERYQVKEDN